MDDGQKRNPSILERFHFVVHVNKRDPFRRNCQKQQRMSCCVYKRGAGSSVARVIVGQKRGNFFQAEKMHRAILFSKLCNVHNKGPFYTLELHTECEMSHNRLPMTRRRSIFANFLSP